VNQVPGERHEPVVSHAISMQSRASRALALGLIGVLGVGILVWYYSNALARETRVRDTAKAAVSGRAQSEMELPSLGRIDPPALVQEAAVKPASADPPAPLPSGDTSSGLSPLPPLPQADGTSNVAEKSPAQLALERRLSGAAFSRATAGILDAATAARIDSTGEASVPRIDERMESQGSALATLLKPSLTQAVNAQVLPTQRLLLPKGAFIDCTLETAIDSSLPGMTTCITATDTFGADGKVVLLERGTKLVGETRGQVQQGSSRIFVLWTEARTPTGVVVPLDSPGADELGRAGLAGRVNRHFWDRFGAAILISMIDGAVQASTRSAGDGGTVIYNPSGTEGIMTEMLKSTVSIPPTVVKAQGDRIQVLVARDLDFRPVYELHFPGAR